MELVSHGYVIYRYKKIPLFSGISHSIRNLDLFGVNRCYPSILMEHFWNKDRSIRLLVIL